jgi:hypothetical protein
VKLSKIRSETYRAARDLGNVEPLTRPKPVEGEAKRQARRCVYRGGGECSHRLCRAAGLFG